MSREVKWRVINWAMSDNKVWIDKNVKDLEKQGYKVQIRSGARWEYKYAIYKYIGCCSEVKG